MITATPVTAETAETFWTPEMIAAVATDMERGAQILDRLRWRHDGASSRGGRWVPTKE